MDYNAFFEQDTFKALDEKKRNNLKKFMQDIKGKEMNQAILDLIMFSKNSELTKDETNILIEGILMSMPKKERDDFFEILGVMSNLT